MPAKKNALTPESCIAGYNNKETKLLAAAFISSIGPDKYDYALFAKLSGFTENTLKKFWPPVKKKVMEDVPNFGAFLGGGSVTIAPTFKVSSSKKRKAVGADTEDNLEPKSSSAETDSIALDITPQKAPAKGKARGKKMKSKEVKEEAENDEESPYGESGMARVSKRKM